MGRLARRLPPLLVAVLIMILAVPAQAASPTTKRVSVSSSGGQGNGSSSGPGAISADGRFVAFSSIATNLVGGDTNAKDDVFVRDRQTGSTRRVSVRPSGAQANDYSFDPVISADGRFVAFESSATNLVGGDTNAKGDIFVRDRQSGGIRRVSVRSSGAQVNGASYSASLSANGRFVTFDSDATNLVAGDTNGTTDVFLRDLQTGITRRLSLSSSGTPGNGESSANAISANGRFVAFGSSATNLVGGDTNAKGDIFVRDLQTGSTRRVSLSSSGTPGNGQSYYPMLSADGRFVAFQSDATNLVGGDTNAVQDVFVRDRQTGRTRRISVSSAGGQGDAHSYSFTPAISADGRFVAFQSDATNLVGSDTNASTDVFLSDRRTGRTRRLSVGASGAPADGDSFTPAISPDARLATFGSRATNLAGSDTNGVNDVFVRGPLR